MHRQNRTVLVVGMGTSPAVLTGKWATVAAQPQMSSQTDNGAQNVGLDVGLERTVIDEIRARPKIRMSEIALKFQVANKVALAAKEALRDAVSDEQGSSIKSIQKSMQKSMQNLGRTDSEIVRKIKDAPNITTLQLAEQIGMSRIGIQKAIARLKAKGIIRRVGPDKGGHWEVVG